MRAVVNIPAAIGLLFCLTIAGEAPRAQDAPTPDAREIARLPERPQARVDTTEPVPTGRTIRVAAGASLQRALDEAQPGDRIVLDARAVYRGPFRLPRKDGHAWIVISAGPDARVPPAGHRVRPPDTAAFPKLVAASGVVLVADPGAHHYRFVGIEIAPAEGIFLTALVQLGDDERALEKLPHHIIFDRCYLHGDRTRGSRRGMAMNSRDTAVIDSHLSDFKEEGADSQALAGWNGAGPFRIANNYLEAAGENLMFGGADPTIPDLVPADIEIVGNHFAKPLAWKAGTPQFEGVTWTVKNLFELKNARRVLVDGNLFEYNWPQAQNGFAILFTVRNQKGRAPWSVVEDVTFVNNLVRHVGAGFNILGRDDNHPSQQTRRIAIRNNLFLDVGGPWGSGRLFQLLEGTRDVIIDHNTAAQTGGILLGGESAPHSGFLFTNNIAPHNRDGIKGTGTRHGLPTLERHFPGAVVRRNLIVGGNAAEYPPDNFFPPSLADVGTFTRDGGRYRLALARSFRHAGTDGRDPGADLGAIPDAATAAPTIRRFGDSATGRSTEGFQSRNKSPNRSIARSPHVRSASNRTSPALIVFWIASILLAYVYVGYPLVEWARGRVRPTPIRPAVDRSQGANCGGRCAVDSGQGKLPSVSIIVVAFNEGERISRRIENVLALDYPRGRLQVIVASDGSTDDTVVRARRYEHDGVKVRAFYTRRGKAATLNDLMTLADGEIVVFADARQTFDRNAIRALVADFADPAVGAVSGELMLETAAGIGTAAGGTAFYWRYEKFIRRSESRTGSMVGATGAVYAIRRPLYEPIPEDTILDDVLIPVRVVRRGYRCVFEPAARAYDTVSGTAREEFTRKVRTIAGTFQLLARERWLLNPFSNPIWFETMSHKALRLTIPALHLAVLTANLWLLGAWLYQLALAAQAMFYAAALVGCVQRQARRRSITIPYAVCLMAWATLVGFDRFLRRRQQVTWERASATRLPT
ncbi:MAG: glycosyltransferase [Acidobacteria bacterium]|nr:glycosyltransferase [Acidobacteriota bacterium]